MKKVLMLTSVASMIDQFNMENINILKEKGFEIHVVANFQFGSTTTQERINDLNQKLRSLGITVHDIAIYRNVFSLMNIKPYKEVKKLINKEKFDLIHCHSPIGSVITRLAAKKARKNGTKVIYTAHGFHFFKGAPLKNWILFYPVECFLSRYTDVIITINREDYNRAKKSFRAGGIEYIPSVGVDTKKFGEVVIDKSVKRKELGINEDSFVILSVGELNKNKNHETIIKSIAKLKNSNISYIICGQGNLENKLNILINELGLQEQVKLLGYRIDIDEISKVSDLFALPSMREGIGLAALEAMAAGLPVVTSNVHGILDYSIDGKTGYACCPRDVDGFAKAINKIIGDSTLRQSMGEYNKKAVMKFDVNKVNTEMRKIYSNESGCKNV